MTADELREYFIENYGTREPWPRRYEVDAATYGNVCQDVFSNLEQNYPRAAGHVYVHLGPFGGIIFKGVELTIKRE
jgi:hypothetical protein